MNNFTRHCQIVRPELPAPIKVTRLARGSAEQLPAPKTIKKIKKK